MSPIQRQITRQALPRMKLRKGFKMNSSRVSQEIRISKRGFGRIDLETVQSRLKRKQTPERVGGKVNPQPPIQPVAERYPALEEQDIVLTFFAPNAREVNVAGNFNGWCPHATPLKNMGAGKWLVRLMLRSGQYEYRFIVDGQWSEDPRASQRMANPYGDFNSLLLVPLAVRTSIL
jgi:hypothetical protein